MSVSLPVIELSTPLIRVETGELDSSERFGALDPIGEPDPCTSLFERKARWPRSLHVLARLSFRLDARSSQMPPYYIAAFRLPSRDTIEVGALGGITFEPGDYVYIGRASRGMEARLARHRRLDDKTLRWHVDYLRERARWLQARLVEADGECALADQVASLPGAERVVEGFGASDCTCDGHLVRLEDSREVRDMLPGDLWPKDGIRARFVERLNRFVVRTELEIPETVDNLVEGRDGDIVEAYLPNTSRMDELLIEGRSMLLEPVDDADRSTDFTVRRCWDGTWVSLEAARAEDVIDDRLQTRGSLEELGSIDSWSSQVEREGHRFDFQLIDPKGEPIWLEVKSLSRAESGEAHLSKTPSSRATEQLETLGDLAEKGTRSAVTFVLQRSDVARLVVGGDADGYWIDSVRRAADRGVEILAFRTRVTPSNLWIERAIPVSGLD